MKQYAKKQVHASWQDHLKNIRKALPQSHQVPASRAELGRHKESGEVWLSLGHGASKCAFLRPDARLLPSWDHRSPARLKKHSAQRSPLCSREAAGSVHRGQLEDVSCLYCRATPLPKSTAQTSQSPGQKKNGIFGRTEIFPLPYSSLDIIVVKNVNVYLKRGSLFAFPYFGSACFELFDTLKCKILQVSIQMLKVVQHGI